MNKNILFQNCKELINLYLITGDKINWGAQIKMAKKLLSIYSIEFFRQYDPQTKFKSLSVFLTKAGKKELEREYSLFCLTKPATEIILEKNPVIQLEEQNKNNKKSKTIQQFVDEII